MSTVLVLAAVLGAFAFWADTNVTAEPLAPEERQRITAVCSRIRFPEVPPDVLINYWTAFTWLQQYDPGKELLLRAVSGDCLPLPSPSATCMLQRVTIYCCLVLQLATVADAQQRTLWQSSLSAPPRAGNEADAAALAEVQADCRLWWTPRAPALVCDTNEATFDLQVTGSWGESGWGPGVCWHLGPPTKCSPLL